MSVKPARFNEIKGQLPNGGLLFYQAEFQGERPWMCVLNWLIARGPRRLAWMLSINLPTVWLTGQSSSNSQAAYTNKETE